MATDPNRRTGRTTRCVREALKSAINGQRVMFVCHTAAMCDYAMRLVDTPHNRDLLFARGTRQMVGRGRRDFSFISGGRLTFTSHQPGPHEIRESSLEWRFDHYQARQTRQPERSPEMVSINLNPISGPVRVAPDVQWRKDNPPPRASKEVREWTDRHIPSGTFVRAFMEARKGDYPPEVGEWYEAWNAWIAAEEAFRKSLPIDTDDNTFRWRMFGGPWLHARMQVTSECDGNGGLYVSHHIHETVVRLMDKLDEGQQRRLASAVYDWHNATQKLNGGLAQTFLDIEAEPPMPKAWNEAVKP